MATASALPTHSASKGFFQVPHSFAENQAALIPAERAVALVILRNCEDERKFTSMNGTTRRPISDASWEAWTGYSPRQVEYAIKGLREKGLEVIGKGGTAKYSWNWERWHDHFRSPRPLKSPNPKPKEREAKQGAKVHEECHDHGCAMLRAGNCPSSTGESVSGAKHESGLFLTTFAQSTAQTVKQPTEKLWAETMAVLCSFFPLITVKFLMRLLQVVRGVFPSITDSELAAAVRIAFVPQQFSAKLFLLSVPNAIARLRREQKAAEEQKPPAAANDGAELPHVLPGLERALDVYSGPPKKKRAIDFI